MTRGCWRRHGSRRSLRSWSQGFRSSVVRKVRGPTVQRVVPLVALALVANAGLIRDRLDVRLPDAIVPPALLMAWLVGQAWKAPPRPLSLAARIVAVAVLLVTMRYASVMGSVEEQLDRAGVFSGVERIPERVTTLVKEMERPWAGRLVPSAPAGEMRPFFDYVERCIPPDQRLLVAAFLPEVAVLAQRPFAGGQVWFMAGAMTSAADHALVLKPPGQPASFPSRCSAGRGTTTSRVISRSSTSTSRVISLRWLVGRSAMTMRSTC